MISLEKAHIIRYKKDGKHLEILADIKKVIEIRNKFKKNELSKEQIKQRLEDLIADYKIYRDSKKGLLAEIDENEQEDLIVEILLNGELQIPVELKREMLEEKKRRIIEIIRKNSIDPSTGLPHTYERIKRAMEKAKVHVDEHKSPQEQVQDVVKKIRSIIPLRFGRARLKIIIPPEHAGKIYGLIHKLGKITSEDWKANGNLVIQLEVPEGEKSEVIAKISNASSGDAKIFEL